MTQEDVVLYLFESFYDIILKKNKYYIIKVGEKKLNPKIIDKNRYKKTTRKKATKNKRINEENIKKKEELQKKIRDEKIKKKWLNNDFNVSYIKLNKNVSVNNQGDVTKFLNKVNKKKQKSQKDYTKFNNYSSLIYKVSISFSLCVVLLILGIVSKIIMQNNKLEDSKTASSNIEKKVSLVQDYDFKVGISKLDSLEFEKSNNLILKELSTKYNVTLITFDTDYNITYKLAKKIIKHSNKEYEIILDTTYDVSIDDIKNAIDNIKKNLQDVIYYSKISNVDSVKQASNEKMFIYLKEDDPYFVYALDFPINSTSSQGEYTVSEKNDDSILISRQTSKSTLKTIMINSYNDSYNMVQDFNNNKIDAFTASSENIMTYLGRHDYGVKKYRDGETIFLLGNVDSKLYKQKEIRQALLYSIDRNKIISDVIGSFYECIDIPYIYSKIEYKYDNFGATNILQSQGWTKVQGAYFKNIDNENTELNLKLLVNKDDSTKVKIAENIKNMAEQNGIKIQINALDENELKSKIDNKDYDIVLANVSINQIPDISFIKSYLNINENVASAINIVDNSSIDELPSNISNLMEVISNQVCCIGICARNTNLVYQSYISGFFDDIGYMKLYKNIENIGKIQDENEG